MTARTSNEQRQGQMQQQGQMQVLRLRAFHPGLRFAQDDSFFGVGKEGTLLVTLEREESRSLRFAAG
jgi:hypothetical protein